MAEMQINHLNGFGGHGAEEIEAAARHPLLRSWNPPTQHSFSKTQMKTLRSLCDAFSPSINYPVADPTEEVSLRDSETTSFQHTSEDSAGSKKAFKYTHDMSVFYGCSASALEVPEDVSTEL